MQLTINDVLFQKRYNELKKYKLSIEEMNKKVKEAFADFYFGKTNSNDANEIKADIDIKYSKRSNYKLFYDGKHFVGTKFFTPRKTGKKRKTKEKTYNEEMLDTFFYEAKHNTYEKYKSVAEENQVLFKYIKVCFDDFYNDPNAVSDDFIRMGVSRRQNGLNARKRRFIRKNFLNKFNKFINFTYDSKKMNEDEFRRKIKKSLSNHHTRDGWTYMGVFERAPETGRLHFHGLAYIPEDDKINNDITLVREYNVVEKCMKDRYACAFYDKRFGRSHFIPLDDSTDNAAASADYIIKYIGKDNGKVFYSRKTPEFLVKEVEHDFVATANIVGDFLLKYLFFDSVFEDEMSSNEGEFKRYRFYHPKQ